jgi:hypothetical protein
MREPHRYYCKLRVGDHVWPTPTNSHPKKEKRNVP